VFVPAAEVDAALDDLWEMFPDAAAFHGDAPDERREPSARRPCIAAAVARHLDRQRSTRQNSFPSGSSIVVHSSAS
jgi:hypothetical protein